MDFSNNGQNRMAPPPPPLPEGMTVIQRNTNRQAPPPLSEGMTVMSRDVNRQVAPSFPDELPPPPIPDEMLRRAREKSEERPAHHVPEPIQMQAPPPPLPTGMMPMQDAVNRSASFSNANSRGGRPTMSLSDAVNQKVEADRKAAEEAAKPRVNANGGRLDVNDSCYARSGMDGLYYYARIDSFDNEKAVLTFFDEARETVKFDKIYTVNNAAETMQCFANWNNQGNYYPAKIKSISDGKFLVNYDENPDVIEELSFDSVRFAPW